MEGEQSTEALIALGLATVSLIVIIFVVVLIGVWRKKTSKEATLALLNDTCDEQIHSIKNDIEQLKKRLEKIESESN